MFRLIVALSILCLVLGTDLKSEGRIVNGRNVHIAEYPYQVSLQKWGHHFCGGSILSLIWILSAAHCVVLMIGEDPKLFTVRGGSSNCKAGGVVKQVEKAIIHELYNPITMVYDVGLIKLHSGFVPSGSIKTINIINKELPAGSIVTVTGWGKLSDDNNVLPTNLQAVDLTLVSKNECSSQKYRYGKSIGESMICAVGPSKDSCQGDSGGPLVDEDHLYQVGVVSWGAGCAEAGLPGVYCDLMNPEVRSFIKKNSGVKL